MSADLNRRILDLLGVPPEDRYASRATLELRPGRAPELTLHYDVFDIRGDNTPVATCHELRPLATQAQESFDLDKLVTTAQGNLACAIEKACLLAVNETRLSFMLLRNEFHRRWNREAERDRRRRFIHREGGHAQTTLLQTIAGVIFFALVLGWLGPKLEDRTYGSYGYTPEQTSEAAQFDAEARARCARHEQDNTGYIATAAGGIICTDKRGRRLATRGKP
jgi:hypothetical protein